MALRDALLEGGDDLLVGDLLALQIALHELVGVLGNLVHELLAVFLRAGLEVVGDGYLARAPPALAGVLVALHVDQVDQAAGLVLRADRNFRRDDMWAERCLQGVQRREEVRALAIEHVHEDQPRQAFLSGAIPQPLGADLDAGDAVDDDHRGVDHSQGAERVGNEARFAGRVDQVDLAVVVVE